MCVCVCVCVCVYVLHRMLVGPQARVLWLCVPHTPTSQRAHVTYPHYTTQRHAL